MRSKGVWIAFAIGFAAGAAVALLYAPQNGARTRRQLRSSLEDAGDYLEEAGKYLRTQAEKLAGEGRKAARQGREQVDSAINSASGVVANLVESAHSLV